MIETQKIHIKQCQENSLKRSRKQSFVKNDTGVWMAVTDGAWTRLLWQWNIWFESVMVALRKKDCVFASILQIY